MLDQDALVQRDAIDGKMICIGPVDGQRPGVVAVVVYGHRAVFDRAVAAGKVTGIPEVIGKAV